MKKKEGLLKAVCGFGKSVVLARMIGTLGKRAIIFVTTDNLRNQMIDDVMRFTTITRDEISTDVLDKDAKVVVSTIQLMNARINKDFKSMFNLYRKEMQFGITFLDEAHLICGPEKFTVALCLLNSKVLVQLTATPTRGHYRQQRIFEHWIGKNRFERDQYEVIPTVKKVIYNSGLDQDNEKLKWARCWGSDLVRPRYLSFLKGQEAYMNLLYTLILWGYKKGAKVVVLSEIRSVLKEVEKYIKLGGVISMDKVGRFYNYKEDITIPPKYREDLISVNINKATADQFTLLKGVGSGAAKKILDYRELNGKFNSITDLTKVSGISIKLLAKLEKFLKLRGNDVNIKRVRICNSKKVKRDVKPMITDIIDMNITLGTFKKCSVGIDVPDWGVCIIASPTGSPTTIEQSAGRILRKAPAVLFHIVDEGCPECIHWFEKVKINFYDVKGFKVT